MINLNYAFCPCCSKEARGYDRVYKYFGFRNFQGKVYVQSHCRGCRSRESTMRKKAGMVKHRNKR